MYRKTYVEINLDYLKSNVQNLISYYNDYKYYFGVVKGNCYGHGVRTVNELIESGINYLAVSSLEEALECREVNQEIPILILEPIHLEDIEVAISNNITITIHEYNYAKEILKMNPSGLKAHIKINSGMNRLGIKDRCEFTEIYNEFKDSNVNIEGIFTHFATLGISDKKWDIQLSNFEEITKDIDLNEVPIVHLARSASFINHPKISFANGIRMGISMYGFDPSPVFSNKGFKNKLRSIKRKFVIKKENISSTISKSEVKLKPAFAMYTEVLQVNKLKKGEFVGYGGSYVAKEDGEIVATIAVGYDDGIFRKSKGRNVVVNGKKFPIIGDVGMGMCSIKADDSVKMFDKVTLIGDGISIREVARHNGTTIYETMCNIDKNVPRVYVRNGK